MNLSAWFHPKEQRQSHLKLVFRASGTKGQKGTLKTALRWDFHSSFWRNQVDRFIVQKWHKIKQRKMHQMFMQKYKQTLSFKRPGMYSWEGHTNLKNIPLSFDMREISSNFVALSDYMNFINCSSSRFSNIPPALLFCFFVLHAWLKLIIEKRVFMIEFLLCERHFSFFTTLCRTLCPRFYFLQLHFIW